jgi:hypothetical protein
MLAAAAGKQISKEEGNNHLIPSSIMLNCVVQMQLCERRRQAVPKWRRHPEWWSCGCVSDVINFRLEQVVIPMFAS